MHKIVSWELVNIKNEGKPQIIDMFKHGNLEKVNVLQWDGKRKAVSSETQEEHKQYH